MPRKYKSANEALKRLQEAKQELARVIESDDERLSKRFIASLRDEIKALTNELQGIHSRLDPVKTPHAVFDPHRPSVIGGFIGIALIAQPREPLKEVMKTPFYGSGVYALYYDGDFEPYQPLRNTHTPIYIGKAEPADHLAEHPHEQGQRLHNRLRDHARSISKAENLEVGNFSCRYLVVQSGWESSAEAFLINLFKPLWNKETGPCHGIGKHGDSPRTRGNLRSPWDTLHPGRDWAWRDPNIRDQIPLSEIKQLIRNHFKSHPPFKTETDILRDFFNNLRQQ